MIQKQLKEFLLEINENPDWEKLSIEIDLQPGYIGVSGYCINTKNEEISLRTKTNETFDIFIKEYHHNNSNIDNKWNKISYTVFNNKNEIFSLFWDEIWQNEIDKLNNNVKQNNSDYILPKWHWENK